MNSSVNAKISAENFIYDDIIRANFVDSYINLTLKTISMLEWVKNKCPKALFILKVDEDVFINIPNLLKFIESKQSEKRTIFGRLAVNWLPFRNKASKYYLSYEKYKLEVFPNFTTGPAYLMTSDCVADLFDKALNLPFIPKLEDVYITGLVAQEVNITRTFVPEFVNERKVLTEYNVKKAISLHEITPFEQFYAWKLQHKLQV